MQETASQWNVKNRKKAHESVIKVIRIGISTILAFAGFFILVIQIIPLSESYLKGKVLEINEANLVSPVPGAYKRDIGGEFAYWDPGRSYFENLITQAGIIAQASSTTNTNNPAIPRRDITIDDRYSSPMYLTVNSLGIKGVKVAPNVESYTEDIYNAVLKGGLAHFKGTPLPGGGGNTFIYGHSAVDNYFSSHQTNPETIFTKLEDIKVGDNVSVVKDGKTYQYIVRRKKIVEPDDFSILNPDPLKETATLMTCYPNGIGTKRLIVTAELLNGE